ncbi:MAG: hypothetical protein J2P55_17185, partial [Rhizobiales bacterium]|nr:hypothetical protein [Hyphomicrobiales bacterium]
MALAFSDLHAIKGAVEVNKPHPVGTVYTLREAAAELKLKPRMVAKIAKRYGLCSAFGRELLFSESDILAIWEIQRWHSSFGDGMDGATSSSGERTSTARKSTSLQKRLMKKPRGKSSSSSK